MNKTTLVLLPQGGMGNQTVQWLFAYGYASLMGFDFACAPWLGDEIFQLPEYRRFDIPSGLRMNEAQFEARLPDIRSGNIEFRGYAQTSWCCRWYTKWEAQSWLRLKPKIEAACAKLRPPTDRVIGHLRHGDLIGYGYPALTRDSYYNACGEFGLDPGKMVLLSEECPTPHGDLPDSLSFMADFYRMMKAPTLLRGNSTFSWVAGLLSDGLVLSPVIDGLEGGKFHDCRFKAGNHQRLANFDFTQLMSVAP